MPSFEFLPVMYDEERRQRYERIVFTTALTVEFEFDQGRRSVHYSKGESVLVWRSWQQTFKDVTQQLDRNGFHMLNASQTTEKDYVLTVSCVTMD